MDENIQVFVMLTGCVLAYLFFAWLNTPIPRK